MSPPSVPPPALHRLSITRNGKIARLPRAVREELNRRLEDGAQGKALVAWLNGLVEVREVMSTAFGGRPVTEQNLSEWRQGGFLDWQRQQEARAWVRQAAEETEELGEAAGPQPLTDVLGASVTLLLSRLIREMGESQDISREQRRDLIMMIRQWCVLRSGDHRAAKLKMQQQDWTTHRERAEEPRKRWEQQQTAAAAQVERGWLSLRSIPGGGIEGLNPDPLPKLAVPQPPATHSQLNQVNPTESDRIVPQKNGKRQKSPRTSSGLLPRQAGKPARPLPCPGHRRAASRPAGKGSGNAAIKPQPRKGGQTASKGLASPGSNRRRQMVPS